MYPTDRRYSKDHEWVLLEADGGALVGITHYAQNQLGDVVFVDLPEPGSRVARSEKLGEVESVKAVSDIFSPVGGEVAEVNQAIADHPELLNDDPYDKGWIVRLASVDSSELQSLLSADEYEQHLSQLE